MEKNGAILMERKVVLNMLAKEKRGALLEGGKVLEWLFEQEDDKVMEGSIVLGKVEDIIPGMDAAFINIGEEKNGLLHRNELREFQQYEGLEEKNSAPSIRSLITKGQKVLVQVKKESVGSKGARLTELLSLPGKYMVYLPYSPYVAVSKKISRIEIREQWREKGKSWTQGEEGVIIRTNAAKPDEKTVHEEFLRLRSLFRELEEKANKREDPPLLIYNESSLLNRVIRDYYTDGNTEVIVDSLHDYEQLVQLAGEKGKESIHLFNKREDIFSAYNLTSELEKTLKSHVWIKNGAFLIIERTEALTVIDVNTGKFLGRENHRDTVLKTNIEAAQAAAHEIRLRNIGGIILIDFIDMKNEADREEVLKTLRQALAKDKVLTNIGGFTQFGLLEITRKKTKQSVDHILLADCPTCSGKGKVYSITTILSSLERDLQVLKYTDAEALLIDVEPRLNELLLDNKHLLLEELEALIDKKLYIIEDRDLLGKTVSYAIRSLGQKEEIRQLWERKQIG